MKAYQLRIFAPVSEVRTFTEYRRILERVGLVDILHEIWTLVAARKNIADGDSR